MLIVIPPSRVLARCAGLNDDQPRAFTVSLKGPLG
jgi:hypothetical protein